MINYEHYPASGMIDIDVRTGQDAYHYCHHRIAGALQYREDSKRNWSGPKDWDKDYMQYRGLDTVLPQGELVVPNETGSAVETYLAFLVHHLPHFKCQPRHPNDVISCAIQEFVLNYDWREYNFQDQFRWAGKDAAITGKGFMRVGWSQPEEFETKNFHKYGRLGTRDYMKPNGPWGRRVSPYDMLIDPEAPEYNLRSARWAGEIYWMPLREIIYAPEGIYNKDVVTLLKAGKGRGAFADAYHLNRYNRGVSKDDYARDVDRIMICDFWDKVYLQEYKFVPGIIPPLQENAWPYLGEDGKPYLDGFPYVEIPFFEIPDSLYGVGIPRWIRAQQHELNRIRTQMFNYHQRLTSIMFTVIANAFTKPEELSKLKDGQMGEFLMARAHEAVKAIAIPNLPPDIYNIEAKIMQDIERTLGLDELVRSGRLPSRTSAREISARTDLLSLKTRPRKAAFDNAAMDVARQILQHEKRWAKGERVMRIAGPVGRYWDQIKQQAQSSNEQVSGPAQEIYGQMKNNFSDNMGQTFISFKSEDIQAEYDLDMISTAMGDYDPDMRRAALQKMYETTLGSIQVLGSQGYVPDMGEFLEKLFEEWEFTDAPRWIPWARVPDVPENYIPPPSNGQGAPIGNPLGNQESAGPVNPASQILGGMLGGQ